MLPEGSSGLAPLHQSPNGERCTPSSSPSISVPAPAHPTGSGGPAHQWMQLTYQTWCQGRHPPTSPVMRCSRLDVQGQWRGRKGCKVYSQLARLLLSLQAPVERWMAQSFEHQALVKETEASFSILLNMFFGIN